jgi:limonene-1,2-epoxide hydrolase
MPASAQIVQDFIAAFIAAWPRGDATGLGSFFAEDAVYQNMPMDPVRGRAAIQATFAEFMRMGGRVGVDVAHMVADGPVVMVERVDHFMRDDATASLPMMGVVEVHDGVITAWRDYFDLTQFTSQLEGGA